ncbi:MAG: 3-phosphoshikimate 1-carboxyvinyltransferase [Bacteroidota bacterium]
MLLLHKSDAKLTGDIHLSSSKSESNRVLLMNALSADPFHIENLSDAKDTQTMHRLLSSGEKIWDVMEAGTTMRFCTAYLGLKGQDHVITGTERMKQRPIGLLAEALKHLGTSIRYEEKDGYPPLRISGLKEQSTRELSIPGNVSSQFISALLMIAPVLPRGLELTLTQEIFSRPYIEMTLALMSHFGINHTWEGHVIDIGHQSYIANNYRVESDWSGASYWYAMMAIAPEGTLRLHGLREKSYQGDQAIVEIMKGFGVETTFEGDTAVISKTGQSKRELTIDFKKCPDLAQGVMVAAALTGIRLQMTGLETLRIKETDRITAMTQELAKIGATLTESSSRWELSPSEKNFDPPIISTYEDHRMAMAFGPLALRSNLSIEEEEVVKKSYPGYWEDLKKVGIRMAHQ